jgi:hypothetical protein
MRDIPSPIAVPCRICSKQEKAERDKAVVDYYINNRLIAYREIHEDLPEVVAQERVESFCLKMYKQDMERIRRKYALPNSKS